MIPHQKFGAGFYFPLTEEQRALSHEIKYIQDPEAVRALRGIAKTRYEAEKFLNRTNKDELLAPQNTAISMDRNSVSNRSEATIRSGGSKSSIDEEVVERERSNDRLGVGNGTLTVDLAERVLRLGYNFID